MHRVKTCRATRRRQKNFRRRADRRQQFLAGGSRSSQTAVPSSGRAGDPNRSSAGPSPARLRPRSGHSPPAPRPRAPPARIQALLAPARPPAVAPRASPGPPPVRSRDARVRLPGGCPCPSARAPPATMFCAISGVTPTDPVISARTGHVFERSLITKAIQVRPPPASDARRPRGARARARPARGASDARVSFVFPPYDRPFPGRSPRDRRPALSPTVRPPLTTP